MSPTAGSRILVLLLLIVGLGRVAAQPASYVDPVGYPGAWPANDAIGCTTCWRPYTFSGQNASDPTGSSDGSTGGTTPQQEADIVNDPSGIAFYYYGDGTNLYFRYVLGGPPGSYTGSGQPYKSTNWSILIDVDGDGYRDFAIMLFGADSGSQPDDIVVMYNTTKSQAVSVPVDAIWRQDSALHTTPGADNTVDGLPGGTAAWNHSGDPYVYDFRRTRVVQIDRQFNPNAQASRYYLDIQIPVAALDATARGGPRLRSRSVISFAATTANSNTNPAQKDFLFPGDYVFSNVNSPLPMGDNITLDGQPPILQPTVPLVTAGTCSGSTPLSAAVSDTLEGWGSNQLRTTVRSVQFFYLADLNGDGHSSAGEVWLAIGTVSMSATPSSTTVSGGTVTEFISPWNTTWDPRTLARGQYLVKAVATDRDGLVTDSALTTGTQANPDGYRVATFQNTCGTATADLQMTKALDAHVREAGEPVVFTLTVRNGGPEAATGVTVSDPLPSGYTFESASPAGSYQAASGLWTVGALAVNATATLNITARVNASGNYANVASVSGSVIDPVPGNNSASAAVSGLVLRKSVCNVTVTGCTDASQFTLTNESTPGDVLEYLVTYRHVGAPINAVILTDEVPTGTVLVQDVYGAAGELRLLCPDAPAPIDVDIGAVRTITLDLMQSCVLGSVTEGASGSFRFRVRVP